MAQEEIVTIEDRRNSLLNRREVKALFKDAAGKVKKIDAVEKIAGQLNVDKKNIIPVSMTCATGMTDVHATFYVYDNPEDPKKQLPRYRMLRTLPKEERKKLLDEEKATRLKAKQAAAAEKGSGGKK